MITENPFNDNLVLPEVTPEVKEKLSNALAQVRAKNGTPESPYPRGQTPYFHTTEDAGFITGPVPGEYIEGQHMPANLMDVPAVEEFKRNLGVEEICKFTPGPDIEIKVDMKITSEDLTPDGLMGKMVRNGAKQILAEELNNAFAEEGITTHYTAEMLSALAAARLRAEQKHKKKARINKRKRK